MATQGKTAGRRRISAPKDVLKRYLAGSMWTPHSQRTGRGGASKASGRGAIRLAKAPEGGWTGGDPLKNGSKR